ncbi:MAG: phosphate ABC transporter permease subunit PstC, partial [Desulfofundulus sp.]
MALQPQEKIFPVLLLLCALTSILVVALVGFFVFYQGYPVLAKTGFFAFLFGSTWRPSEGVYGILPMV